MHEDGSESNVKGDEAAGTRDLHFIPRKFVLQLPTLRHMHWVESQITSAEDGKS